MCTPDSKCNLFYCQWHFNVRSINGILIALVTLCGPSKRETRCHPFVVAEMWTIYMYIHGYTMNQRLQRNLIRCG
jgi:hypothetical protein